MPENYRELPEEVVAALLRGRKLEAVRLLINARGLGLKEAKDMVDACLASRPDIAGRMEEEYAHTRQSVLRWVIIAAALAAAAWLMFGKL